MEAFVAIYEKIIKAITNIVGIIAGFMVLFCGFIIVYEVLRRGVFNAPTEWVMEISTYCIIIAGFLGMGVAYAGKKHIAVDIFLSKIDAKTKCYIEVVTSLFGIFYSGLFMLEAWDMVMLSIELNNCAPTTLGTPLWIPQMAMPVGMAVLLLQIVGTLLVDLVKIKKQDFGEEGSK